MNTDLKQRIESLLEETENKGVRLVAATKTVCPEIINEAVS